MEGGARPRASFVSWCGGGGLSVGEDCGWVWVVEGGSKLQARAMAGGKVC